MEYKVGRTNVLAEMNHLRSVVTALLVVTGLSVASRADDGLEAFLGKPIFEKQRLFDDQRYPNIGVMAGLWCAVVRMEAGRGVEPLRSLKRDTMVEAPQLMRIQGISWSLWRTGNRRHH